MRHRMLSALVTVLVGMASTAEWAQNGVVPAFEVVVGYAGYVDEGWDHRTLVGRGVRWSIARTTLGPELAFQHGREGSDELVATLAGTYALVPAPRSRRAWPFAVVATGMSRRSEIVGRARTRPGSRRSSHTRSPPRSDSVSTCAFGPAPTPPWTRVD